MPTDLSQLVSIAPDSRWFYYVETGEELELVDEKPPDDKYIMGLHLKYVDRRRQRQLMTGHVGRKALSRKGLKALVSSDDQFRMNLLKEALLDWHMTARAIFLLHAELDVEKLDPNVPIEFNPVNVETLGKFSELTTDVYTLETEHDEWFGSEGDAGGNSDNGPNGSSDGSPVETVSETT